MPRLPPIPVELRWAGKPSEKPIEAKLRIVLISMTRSFGGSAASAPGTPPATLELANYDPSLSGVLVDDYYLRVGGLSGRLYVQGIHYGTEDITHAPLRAGSAMSGAGVRVTVGHDGGLLTARVVDGAGRPVPDATVVVMPGSAASAGEFADRVQIDQADQHGEYRSRALEPGRYFAFAMTAPAGDLTPELIERLQAFRSRAHEFVVEPNGTVELELHPSNFP